MKLFVAGPEPDELRRCAEEGLCEGVAVLGTEAMDPSPSARARLAALGAAFAGPILVEIGARVDTFDDATALGRSLKALGPHFAARSADYDLFRKTRALVKAFELGTELLVGPLGDVSSVFDSSLMGVHGTLASPAVLRGIAARRG